MPRLTYEDIKNFDDVVLRSKSKSYLRDLIRKTRVKTQARLEQLERAKSVFSPAKQKFDENFESKAPSKMTKNQMIHELIQHKSFHRSKTSTVSGAREVATNQDIMIFGRSEKNPARPAHRMNSKQRERFWSIYDEFLRTYKDAYARFRYQSIWEHLGEMQIAGKIKTAEQINTEDLEELLNRLEQAQEEEDLEEYDATGPNVYTGRRFD